MFEPKTEADRPIWSVQQALIYMQYCPKCGSQLDGGGKFCGGCGSSLTPDLGNSTPIANTVGDGKSRSSALLWVWATVIFLFGAYAYAVLVGVFQSAIETSGHDFKAGQIFAETLGIVGVCLIVPYWMIARKVIRRRRSR
jgi:hypothetical protein